MKITTNNIDVGLTKEEYVYLEILKSFIVAYGKYAYVNSSFADLKEKARLATAAAMIQLDEINPIRPEDIAKHEY